MKPFNALFKALALLLLTVAVQATQARDSIWIENKQVTHKEGKVAIDLAFPQLDSQHGTEELLRVVNRSVVRTLVSGLPIDTKFEVQTLDQLRLSLATQVSELQQIARQMPGVKEVPFELYSQWKAFGNHNIVSIYIERYFFMGGARAKTHGTYLTFDTRTAQPLDIRSLIPDTTAFLAVVAQQFCKERRLPQGALQLETGLFYELSNLPMPKQMGFSDKGLVVYYNPNEIAPSALGPIVVTIPAKMAVGKYKGLLDKVNYRKGGKRSFDANTARRDADLWGK